MPANVNLYPDCFSDIDMVFPMTKNGLRMSPETCLSCEHKTSCLREALHNSQAGVDIKHEHIDRAYRSRMIGFWDRWSRKKTLNRLAQRGKRRRKSFFQNLFGLWQSNNTT